MTLSRRDGRWANGRFLRERDSSQEWGDMGRAGSLTPLDEMRMTRRALLAGTYGLTPEILQKAVEQANAIVENEGGNSTRHEILEAAKLLFAVRKQLAETDKVDTEREEGRPVQRVEVTGADGDPIQVEQRHADIRESLAPYLDAFSVCFQAGMRGSTGRLPADDPPQSLDSRQAPQKTDDIPGS